MDSKTFYKTPLPWGLAILAGIYFMWRYTYFLDEMLKMKGGGTSGMLFDLFARKLYNIGGQTLIIIVFGGFTISFLIIFVLLLRRNRKM